MSAQPEALRLADALEISSNYGVRLQAAEELRRLHDHEIAMQDWIEKTEWVQQSQRPGELGMHRADVIRLRIEQANAQRNALLETLRFIADHDLRGADLIACGHIAHALIGKARAAIKAAEDAPER